jgi:flagellar biosynthesis protein FlhG
LIDLDELDYYETLEILRDASLEDIEKAYELLRNAYSTDSLALHSVFSEGDASVMRDRIDEAYRVLSDFELRRDYDATRRKARGFASTNTEEFGAEGDPQMSPIGSPQPLDHEIDQPDDGKWDGSFLRRARIQAGMELEEIAEVTKVGIRSLRLIEDDAYEELPATVYVRGFVTAYVRTLGIDSDGVVASYVQRVEESRSDQGRGRFLGRR